MNFFKSIMSIDENKHSIIVWSFLICLVIGIYQTISQGDISTNFLTLILTQIGVIFGSNVVTTVTKSKNEYGRNDDENNPTI